MIKRFTCGHEHTVRTRSRGGILNVQIVCPKCWLKSSMSAITVEHFMEIRMNSGKKIKLHLKDNKTRRD